MNELLGANTGVLDQVAQSLSSGALRMQDIRTLAQRALFEMQAGWNGSDLLQLTHQWEQQVSPRLAEASMSLDRCAARLRAQSTAQREASRSLAAGSGLFPVATVPLLLGQTDAAAGSGTGTEGVGTTVDGAATARVAG